MADSDEKLCRLVSEFGRVRERRKVLVNVGKCKILIIFIETRGHITIGKKNTDGVVSSQVPEVCGS